MKTNRILLKVVFYVFILVLSTNSILCAAEYESEDEKVSLNKESWASMSSINQLICALSSHLTTLNYQYNRALNPAQKSINAPLTEPDEKSIRILMQSWSIFNNQNLIDQIKQLEENGHNKAYNELLEISNKYPNLSITEISSKECLSIIQTIRLCFVQSMKDKLGTYGLEAWDKGRELNILRWGIAAQHISEEDALKIMTPIALDLQQHYASWEDFTSHYIAGRTFYALYSGDYENNTDQSIKAAIKTKQSYPVTGIPMYGDTTDKNSVLSLYDIVYRPTTEAKVFDKLYKLYNARQFTENDLTYIDECFKTFPNIPCIHALKVYVAAQLLPMPQVLDIAKQADVIFSVNNLKNQVCDEFYQFYIITANNVGSSKDALYAISQLSSNMQNSGWSYFHKGLAYAQFIITSQDTKNNKEYFKKAKENFTLAEQNNYEIPQNVVNWLNSNPAE